ncbi:M1 family metallopeptidase [Asticcacaulis sp. AC402]|uniref:M1 family metallopeptidase n=1 Tax=Asticcacaulis sp. AC402 TaxID=1282361 RepID=UPI0003C3E266|nr:M1 family metallopeptidase [Asticcacaulis sp. AC402]ESQ77220.1 peptidase M1 [Asticcacaulis sp. AC402]
MRALFLAFCLLTSPVVATTAAAQTSSKPAAPAAAYPQGKLPDTAKPTAYRLALTIIPSKPRFTGHVEIDVVVKEQTSSLFIHGRDLKVSSATVLQNDKTIKAKYTQVDPLGVVRLDFAKPVAAGKATLVFDYDAAFGDTAAGLYRVQVDGEWYVWSQFQSIDARSAFPSFDEPGYKTPFKISIIADEKMVVASNFPRNNTLTEGKLVRSDFYQTSPLPTYLIAFAVGPFAVAEGVVAPTPQRSQPLNIRIMATQPNKDKLQYALQETGPIVAHLEAYFNQGFPYPKLDQVASPIMPGAMENAGLDIYGDNILLLDAGADTNQKRDFGMIVAHELSHQWFGDYVTPAWWDDIWLNESFANWMGYRIGNEWRPELNIGAGAIDEAFAAMNTDSLKVGRPIRQPIINSADIDQAFDSITYGKGGQVVAMVAAYLGDQQFREGVRLHMSRHPHGSATTDQFFGNLADSAQNPKVLEAMKSFIYQQGVPVVEFSHVGGYLVATQSRYTRLGSDQAPQTWTIPLCVRRGTNESCFMLDLPEGNLGVDNIPGEIMPNAGGTGYYRFALTPEDWDKLIATGATIKGGEGLAASDSLWAQFAAGKLAPAKLIDSARVMAGNPDSRVAVDGGQRLAGLRTAGIIGDEAEVDYRRVMAGIYGPRLAALGFDPKAGAHASDTPDAQSLRTNLVNLMADDADDAGIRSKLTAAAVAYLGGDKTAVDQSVLALALAVHVEDGGLPAAKALYEMTVTSTDELFRQSATVAVTHGATTETANWLFGVLLSDTRLRATERLRLLSGLMGQPKARDVTFDWYKANYDALSKGIGIFSASRLQTLAGGYCSAARADELDAALRSKVVAAGRGTLSFDRTLERVRSCGVLKDAKAGEVAAAFRAAS